MGSSSAAMPLGWTRFHSGDPNSILNSGYREFARLDYPPVRHRIFFRKRLSDASRFTLARSLSRMKFQSEFLRLTGVLTEGFACLASKAAMWCFPVEDGSIHPGSRIDRI